MSIGKDLVVKKVFISLCIVSTIFLHVLCAEQQVKIIDYTPSHKDGVMEIVFQEPLRFFAGSSVVKRGFMPAEVFAFENSKEMENVFNDKLRIKKVLVDGQKVIGFIEFFKTKEMSLESLKTQCQAQGLPFDEKQVLAMMPYLKKTDAECAEFVKIECLAVSTTCRRKGFGRKLMQHALDTIQQLWPTIKKVQLDVNADNDSARKLYETEGFIASEIQPAYAALMDTVQYEKVLS